MKGFTNCKVWLGNLDRFAFVVQVSQAWWQGIRAEVCSILTCLLKGGIHGHNSFSMEEGAVGSWWSVTRPPSGSSGLLPCSLGLQPGLRERGDDPGPPAAPRGGTAGADVRTSPHDPVRLPAQPGPRGPPQGALLRLLMDGPWPPGLPALTVPWPHPPLLPLFVTTTHPVSPAAAGFSLACPCLGGHPAGLAPEGPLWEQVSVTGVPLLATFKADPCLGLAGDVPALPPYPNIHTTRQRLPAPRSPTSPEHPTPWK